MQPEHLPVFCRWILSRLNTTIGQTIAQMEAYDFSHATSSIYAFWQYDLCDVFIELVKPVIWSGDEAAMKPTRDTLWACLEIGLRLLHPFMPFLTEELWQRLPKDPSYAKTFPSITVSEYPKVANAFVNAALEKDFAYQAIIVNRIRSIRMTYGLTSSKQKPDVYLQCSAEAFERLSPLAPYIAALSTSAKVECVLAGAGAGAGSIPKGCCVAIVDDAVSAHVVLTGLVDPAKEIQRLEKKRLDTETRKAAVSKKMAMPDYGKTPDKIKEDDRERLTKFETELASIAEAIQGFQTLTIEG